MLSCIARILSTFAATERDGVFSFPSSLRISGLPLTAPAMPVTREPAVLTEPDIDETFPLTDSIRDFASAARRFFLFSICSSSGVIRDCSFFTAETRAPNFYQLALRRLTLDSGDYHPLDAQRGSIGYPEATQVVVLEDSCAIDLC